MAFDWELTMYIHALFGSANNEEVFYRLNRNATS